MFAPVDCAKLTVADDGSKRQQQAARDGSSARASVTHPATTAKLKKLTITVDDEVYAGLHAVIGRSRVSRFLNDLAGPLVVHADLKPGYAAMAADEAREAEAEAWSEGLIGDVATDPHPGR